MPASGDRRGEGRMGPKRKKELAEAACRILRFQIVSTKNTGTFIELTETN